jgi:DinB superfamily
MKSDLRALLAELDSMPAALEAAAHRVGERGSTPPPGGGFSFIEQVWHLADLEREGWGMRLERLRKGGRPTLHDIDGGRLARERSYRTRPTAEGLAAFREARRRNLELFRSASPTEWSHQGVLESVGRIRLRDLPRLMRDHDRSHREEIRSLIEPPKDGVAASAPSPPCPGAGWYLLIHQLPPRPLYLRAKIRNRLSKVGAVALKNSVYVLPRTDRCHEDFQWIAQEAVAGGGQAYVCRAEVLSGTSDEALIGEFRRQSGAAYEGLKGEIAEALQARRKRGARASPDDLRATVLRLKARREEIAAADFFRSPLRDEVDAMIGALERGGRRPRGRGKAAGEGGTREDLGDT